MGLGPLIMTPYQFLEESAEMQYPKTYVSGLTGSISKYNIADSIDSKNTSYYFPTRVWKAADNNVFVDIQIENGGMLSSYDVEKINNNIIYSNMSGVKEDSLYLFDQEKVFLVDARYFDSDISQGMLPEFGLKLANRAPWEPFGDMTAHSSYDVVLNDDANNLLRDYFKEVKRLHNEDLPINTLEIMKEISEQHNIPFEDAINIWAVHTLSSVLMGRASMDLYIKSYD